MIKKDEDEDLLFAPEIDCNTASFLLPKISKLITQTGIRQNVNTWIRFPKNDFLKWTLPITFTVKAFWFGTGINLC